MGSGKKVQILLSTYNGEKYLREQLDSYIGQTCFPIIRVLIRDDGSTDGTVGILKEYAERYGFEILYGENIGVNASYGVLLQASDPECAYFALSDQDDVWLPEKIEIALHHLTAHEGCEPALFFSLSRIVDERLNTISESHFPTRGTSFYNAMVQNVCPGHTQVWNAAMRERLLRTDFSHAHILDWWIYLLASGTGKLYFAPQCTVLHRQHGNNAVGYEMNPLKNLLILLKRVRSKEAAAISRQLECFLQDYGEELSDAYRTEVKLFLGAQASIIWRFSYIIHSKIFRQARMDTILVYLLYLLGKYRMKDR